jgi:carbamoyl-phosphate synthase small subunit
VDLAKDVTCAQSYRWDEMRWAWPEGYTAAPRPRAQGRRARLRRQAQHPALPRLAGCDVTVLPATATAEEVLAQNARRLFLSNGPAIRRRPAPMPCR